MALLYLGLILVIFLLITGFPIFLSVVLYRYQKKGKTRGWLKYLAIIPVLWIGYYLYSAVFPDDDFYKSDYTEVTGLEFPADAKIISKTASFPDLFGDYISVFVIRTSEQKYSEILSHLKASGFGAIEDNRHSPEMKDELNLAGLKVKTGLNSIKKTGIDFYVAFLSDNRSILVRRISW